MITVAAGLVWVGYTLSWRGWMLLQGCGNTIGDLVIPGRFTPCGTGASSKLPKAIPDKPPSFTPGASGPAGQFENFPSIGGGNTIPSTSMPTGPWRSK